MSSVHYTQSPKRLNALYPSNPDCTKKFAIKRDFRPCSFIAFHHFVLRSSWKKKKKKNDGLIARMHDFEVPDTETRSTMLRSPSTELSCHLVTSEQDVDLPSVYQRSGFVLRVSLFSDSQGYFRVSKAFVSKFYSRSLVYFFTDLERARCGIFE